MARERTGPPRAALLDDPKFRGIVYQILLCLLIALAAAAVVRNVTENLARNRITSGFGFLDQTAGFDISQTLIDYSVQTSTYGRAFWVGLLNTLLIAGLGIVLATVWGFVIGIARLSRNWLVANVARGYVELIRNIPLLLQLLFWYNAVLKALPEMRESIVFGGAVLNNRGLFLPQPNFGPGTGLVALAFVIGIASALGLRLAAKRRLERTGQTIPVFGSSLALVIGLPVIAFLLAGAEVRLVHPELGRFNVRGGVEILPEFGALLFGLVVYTAAFIAEVVRAGLLSVSRGQTEAAAALGLRRRQILNLIVIPQAKRVIIPPLTNQYLNLTKNSSLAVAIGYPDFVQIFTGTVLNQTGQAVEVVVITLAVYLALSLTTSAAMNWYNARVAYVGR
ncbi:MAG: amino acid ABC transporter permease [Xanthobacteraceae bacterium]